MMKQHSHLFTLFGGWFFLLLIHSIVVPSVVATNTHIRKTASSVQEGTSHSTEQRQLDDAIVIDFGQLQTFVLEGVDAMQTFQFSAKLTEGQTVICYAGCTDESDKRDKKIASLGELDLTTAAVMVDGSTATTCDTAVAMTYYASDSAEFQLDISSTTGIGNASVICDVNTFDTGRHEMTEESKDYNYNHDNVNQHHRQLEDGIVDVEYDTLTSFTINAGEMQTFRLVPALPPGSIVSCHAACNFRRQETLTSNGYFAKEVDGIPVISSTDGSSSDQTCDTALAVTNVGDEAGEEMHFFTIELESTSGVTNGKLSCTQRVLPKDDEDDDDEGDGCLTRIQKAISSFLSFFG